MNNVDILTVMYFALALASSIAFTRWQNRRALSLPSLAAGWWMLCTLALLPFLLALLIKAAAVAAGAGEVGWQAHGEGVLYGF